MDALHNLAGEAERSFTWVYPGLESNTPTPAVQYTTTESVWTGDTQLPLTATLIPSTLGERHMQSFLHISNFLYFQMRQAGQTESALPP